MTTPRIRVLLTKIGLDGHDRGIRIVSVALRDAGMEVILTPPWMTLEGVVSIAMQEDVDVIGISSLSCDHLLVPKLMQLLREAHMTDVTVVVGGIVPKSEVQALLESGVAAVFHPGCSLEHIVKEVSQKAAEHAVARSATS